MTDLSDRVGQLFVFGFPGPTLDDEARSLLGDWGCGGVILFSRNIESLEQVVALNREVLAAADPDGPPPLISVDQEGGRVARLRGICTDLPSMRALGAASEGDPDLPYRTGAMVARELGALGFHLNFAPVVDVDTNPDNPVIGERAFGSDASEVAERTVSFLRGMQQGGIGACAKHFPGHGDTETDSHVTLPVLRHDVERLRGVELVPFQAAVAAQVASIMTAHVRFPALDEDRPATLSPAILSGVLRDELGYGGLVISDDCEMAGVAAHYDIETIAVEGLRAGIDLFLICHTAEKVRRAITAVRAALDDGRVSADQVRRALARVDAFKTRFIGAPAPPELDAAREIVRCPPHLALAASIGADAHQGARASSLVDQS